MARRETLTDLLRSVLTSRRLTKWCIDANLRPGTISKLLDGITVPRRGTVINLASALHVSEERIRAACEASRLVAR